MRRAWVGLILGLAILFVGCGKVYDQPKIDESEPQPQQEIKIQEDGFDHKMVEQIRDQLNHEILKEKYLVYDIEGYSETQTKAQRKDMLAKRKKCKGYATEFTDTVFINDQPSSNSIYLTFDDGPDREITPQIVKILDEYGVKGNFFFLGDRVWKFPEVVEDIHERGHYIGIHAFDHVDLRKLTFNEIDAQITFTQDEIYKITGQRPLLIRPPYGGINEDVIQAVDDHDCKIILWSIDTLDWAQKDPKNILKNVKDNLKAGDIILMHSNGGQSATVEALPKIIEIIKEKGYKIASLDELEGSHRTSRE